MRILGIDPGLKRTGFATLESAINSPSSPPTLIDAGCFTFKQNKPIPERLVELEQDLCERIERDKPEYAAVEALYAHRDFPATAIIMAHARGVILLCFQRAGIKTIELSANTIKKSVTGHGHASKEQVASAVASILCLDDLPSPSDVADAMAVALCGLTRIER